MICFFHDTALSSCQFTSKALSSMTLAIKIIFILVEQYFVFIL